MLLTIRVEAEFAEERTEDHGTTSSQLRRSDRGGFPTAHCGVLFCPPGARCNAKVVEEAEERRNKSYAQKYSYLSKLVFNDNSMQSNVI
ncbi:hypothetical protein LXL04_023048 [Taraxacum kok-saghyz]